MLNRRVLLVCLLAGFVARSASAEVVVRWDLPHVPARDSLGVSALAVPASNPAAAQEAMEKGYRVFLLVEASALPALKIPGDSVAGIVINGSATPEQLQALRRRLPSTSRVLSILPEGKWPHVRLNWVTLRNDVLQVSSRTAQPWIENNGARLHLERTRQAQAPRLLSYTWEPITVSDMHQGPALENYLVAIAEAGTFGGDLLLPLHERFQRSLLLGQPVARSDWQQIRRYLEFYSWDLPSRYERISNIGVVTGDTDGAFEILNLLVRHNLSFEVIKPGELASRKLDSLAMLVVIDEPGSQQVNVLERFARAGGIVVLPGLKGPFPWQSSPPALKTDEQLTYKVGEGLVLERPEQISDPNSFALEMRQALPREKRVLEIWNGTTVLATPYQDPGSGTLLITLLNYAHESSPVQIRVRGTYSVVQYETPDAPAVLIPHRQSEGQTEFVLPDLRVGGRVFLTRDAISN
jgi:hypothetical protein